MSKRGPDKGVGHGFGQGFGGNTRNPDRNTTQAQEDETLQARKRAPKAKRRIRSDDSDEAEDRDVGELLSQLPDLYSTWGREQQTAWVTATNLIDQMSHVQSCIEFKGAKNTTRMNRDKNVKFLRVEHTKNEDEDYYVVAGHHLLRHGIFQDIADDPGRFTDYRGVIGEYSLNETFRVQGGHEGEADPFTPSSSSQGASLMPQSTGVTDVSAAPE